MKGEGVEEVGYSFLKLGCSLKFGEDLTVSRVLRLELSVFATQTLNFVPHQIKNNKESVDDAKTSSMWLSFSLETLERLFCATRTEVVA